MEAWRCGRRVTDIAWPSELGNRPGASVAALLPLCYSEPGCARVSPVALRWQPFGKTEARKRFAQAPEEGYRFTGFTGWFTGLPGAGKTTLARLLEKALTQRGVESRC